MEAEDETSFAFAAGDAAIVVWLRRKQWYSHTHQPLTVTMLEHEAAHICAYKTGRPSDGEWEAAIRADADDPEAPLEGCLISPDIAAAYEREEWL